MTVAYDRFAAIYDRWISSGGAEMDACRDFYVRRLRAVRGTVVELGVGNGRILIEAARAGVRCVGVDYSRKMLDLCRAHAEKACVAERIELLQADFRDFALPAPAECIVIPYDSIGHMATRESKAACFRQVLSQLVPGGRFILDQRIFTDAALRELVNIRLRDVYPEPSTGRDVFVFSGAQVDRAAKRFRSFLWVEESDAEGVVTRRTLGGVDNSWIDPSDLCALLGETGFTVTESFGGFDESPLKEGSPHQVWVARRPG